MYYPQIRQLTSVSPKTVRSNLNIIGIDLFRNFIKKPSGEILKAFYFAIGVIMG